jgi:hypothetical protein
MLASCVFAAACGSAQTSRSPPSFSDLGQVEFPNGYLFDGTTVGGLSAISYDPGRQVNYFISDDRSAKNPARFYTVRITFPDNKLGSVDWLGTTPLLDRAGQPFPPLSADAIPPDPEGIAFDERRQQLYWSSEGERMTDDPAHLLMQNPWVRVAGLDGGFRGQFVLSPVLDVSADDTAGSTARTWSGDSASPSPP